MALFTKLHLPGSSGHILQILAAVLLGFFVSRSILAQGPPDNWFVSDTRIYFTSNSVASNRDILSIRPDGTELTQLTVHSGFDQSEDVSPDGQDLLFVSNRLGFGNDLYVMNLLPPIEVSGVLIGSGNYLEVVNPWTGEDHLVHSVATATWSPDGTLIYVRLVVPTDAGGGLYSVNPDGSNLTFIRRIPCFGNSLSLSPDGSQAVCRGGDIFLLDLGDLSLTNLTNSPGIGELDPDWSPDGEWIVFGSEVETPGAPQLYLMRPDGTDTTRLTFSGLTERELTWSPDGEQIAFSRLLPGWSLHTIDIDGNNDTFVVGGASQFAREPVWAIIPSPSSLADCQNGGWEGLGFANQGACVRFLRTGRDTRRP